MATTLETLTAQAALSKLIKVADDARYSSEAVGIMFRSYIDDFRPPGSQNRQRELGGMTVMDFLKWYWREWSNSDTALATGLIASVSFFVFVHFVL